MIIPKTRATAFGICAAAILAGCAGPNASSIAPAGSNGVGMAQTTTGQRSYFAGARPLANAPAHAGRFKRWMEPAAKNDRLLYVSDFYSNVVQVYRYPAHGSPPPVGTLTGLTNPQGMCVDKAQNIYVANTGTAQILEYAHGGTTPINTYNDTNQFPVGCSVNPMTGEVAVGNIFGASSNGSVTVFSADGSTSTNYTDPNVFEMFFPGYDSSGNLYVEGAGYYGVTVDELPSGGSSLTNLALSGVSIGFPGNMMADGTNLVVGDQSCSTGNSCTHGATSDGTTLTGTGVDTNFGGSVDVPQPFLKRGVKGIVGCDAVNFTCDTWTFPAGGPYEPRKHLILTGAAAGTVISVGKNS